MPTTNGFTTVAREFLESRHTQLWSTFNLFDPLEFEQAVDWLASVFAEALKPKDPMQ